MLDTKPIFIDTQRQITSFWGEVQACEQSKDFHCHKCKYQSAELNFQYFVICDLDFQTCLAIATRDAFLKLKKKSNKT